MANRHGDFDEFLAAQFEDIGFAQTYLMILVNEEGMSLDEALREMIIAMGLQAFADKAGVSVQYISDFVNRRRKFTTETMGKYLQKAFDLRIKITVESNDTEVA